MDFVNGKADPWGMKVNPTYKKIKLPTSEWPLLDDYVAADRARVLRSRTRRRTSPSSPHRSPPCARSPRRVLDAWPNVQTKCERRRRTDPWKIGRVDRQGVGTRFMLGSSPLGDAERSACPRPAWRPSPADLRRPRPTHAMAKAIRVAEPDHGGDAAVHARHGGRASRPSAATPAR